MTSKERVQFIIAGDVYRASGFWTCFHHNLMDLFGMEEYMVKMYTHPDDVEAVTDRVCAFYHEANERKTTRRQKG